MSRLLCNATSNGRIHPGSGEVLVLEDGTHPLPKPELFIYGADKTLSVTLDFEQSKAVIKRWLKAANRSDLADQL